MVLMSKHHESISDQPIFRFQMPRNSWGCLYGITLVLISITPSMAITPSEFNHPWFGPRLAERWSHQEGMQQEYQSSQNPSTESPVPDLTMVSDPELRKWHVDMAIQTSFSKLSSTEQKLDRQLDWPLKIDVLNWFSHPRTPVDRKSSFNLNTFYFALGKRVSDRVIVNGFLGFAPGVDRDHQQFLMADLRVNFEYSSYLIGVKTEYYPWGFPRYHNDTDWKKRIDASRVYFYCAILTGYLSAEGAGRYKLFGVRVYHDSIKIRDWISAGIVGMGWSIPISDRWSIQLAGDYSFHAYRPEEYNGWRISTGLRFRF